jgi:UDP-glucose 4-epimerase
MSSKSVLITGAAGFIGSHLAEHCLSLGWHVTGIDAFTDYYAESLKRSNVAVASQHPNFRLIEDDLLQMDLGPVLDNVAIVFHLAAQPGVRASWDKFHLYTRHNLDATHRVLQAVRGRSVERLVLASSSSIYGDAEALPTREDVAPRPVSPYGVTKAACEHLASIYWRNFGVPTVCLRYFSVYGPRQRPDMAFHRLIADVLAGRPFTMFGDGEQTRDFTFVADAVSGTITAAESAEAGSAYNIGGGSRRSMNSVLETLGELIGRYVDRDYRHHQLGDARDTGADIDRARRELGFAPTVEFDIGLAAQLAWHSAMISRDSRPRYGLTVKAAHASAPAR